MNALLDVKHIDVGYGFLQVLWEVSFTIETGEYVCLIGPNGAGKSTTLKSIMGLLAPQKGDILFKGEPIAGLSGNKVCQKGIGYISEGANLFTGMTVRENLLMGAYTVGDRKQLKENLDFVFTLFPRLKEREKQLAGTMSGGERKMLTVGRGIMATPSLLLVDEPSLGLAPLVTNDVFAALDVLRKRGITLLLVEQNAVKALKVTSRGYVLEKGKIVLHEKSQDLAKNDHVKTVFLGV
jgi:ABC-type branched-subunit amino acid transport system ATPase component